MRYFHEANDYLWDKFNHGLIDRLHRADLLAARIEHRGLSSIELDLCRGAAFIDVQMQVDRFAAR